MVCFKGDRSLGAGRCRCCHGSHLVLVKQLGVLHPHVTVTSTSLDWLVPEVHPGFDSNTLLLLGARCYHRCYYFKRGRRAILCSQT